MRYQLVLLVQLWLVMIIAGCSKNESMMTDMITVDTLYTQAEKLLPNWNNSQIHVKMTGKDTVYGYFNSSSGSTIFYSLDGLKTITTNNLPGSDWYISYFEKENIIIERRGSISDFQGFEIRESSDFGKSFVTKANIIGQDWVYNYSPAFNCNREGVFFVEQSHFGKRYSNGFDVFKISANSYDKISKVNLVVDYLSIPKLLCYTDDKNIFFIAYGVYVTPKPSYIVHSNDGGITWESKLIETMPPINNYGNNEYLHNNYLSVISLNKYAFYVTNYDEGIDIYYSYDKGVNWLLKDFKIDGFIKSIQFVNSEIGYMLVQSKVTSNGTYYKDMIYKSVDSGETWSVVCPDVYAKAISFDAKGNGIAISNKIVQITNDGGLTWKLITYFDEYNW